MPAGARPVTASAAIASSSGAAATRPWWLSATALACVLAVVRLVLVIVSPYDRAVGLFDDDAFYYFGVARNVADGAGSTFNQLDPTNGYHPLWLLLLVPVFAVTEGHTALVTVTLVSSVLFIASARFLDRIGTLTGRPLLVTICAAPLLVVGTAGPSFWFSGMETGLLLLAMLAVAVGYLRSDGYQADWFTGRHARAAGVLIALTVLSRLDAVFPMALLGALTVLAWLRAGRPVLRLAAWLAAPTVLAVGAYLAINLMLFDTALPVSGQAKALGGSSVNTGVITQFLGSPVLFGRSTLLGAIAIVVVVVALLGKPAAELATATRFGAIVLVGGALTVGYYAVTSSWQLWPWYFYAAPLAIALAGPSVLARIGVRRPSLKRVGALVACLLVLAASTANAVRSGRGGVTRAAFIEVGPAVAAELDVLVPARLPIAMGDRAGSLGYHLKRPMVHLEGLVNSAGYLEALRTGRVPEFLAARGVGLYGRGDAAEGEPDPDHRGCRRFVEPAQGGGTKVTITVCDTDLVLDHPIGDGTSYRVWRYRPDLNRA